MNQTGQIDKLRTERDRMQCNEASTRLEDWDLTSLKIRGVLEAEWEGIGARSSISSTTFKFHHSIKGSLDGEFRKLMISLHHGGSP